MLANAKTQLHRPKADPRSNCPLSDTLKSITFINRCYWPDSEATGQLLTELCEHLSPRWDVSAVVGQPNWAADSESFVTSGVQNRNGVNIHRLEHKQLPKHQRFARIRSLISFTLAVRKWGNSAGRAILKRSEVSGDRHTVVCETDPFLLPLVVAPMVRRHQARIVYYLQDIYPDVAVALGVTKNSWPIQFLRHRLKQAYLAADCIVVLDEDMRDRLVGWGLPKDRLRIVANWMDCNTVKPVKENNAFRKTNGVDDRFVVMHSGNMGMTQRLEVLIDAMKRPEIQSSALLMLVGNGAKRISLEKQATEQSNVRFLDYQPRDQLAASLSAADLHVVSMDQSITGCLAPSKLYGIFASGTPVLAIVPKDNAVWRLVSQENLGWTVAPGDQAGIAKAINEAQTLSRHALTEMGLRGRALAMRLYDKQICCDAFESVLNEVSAR